MSSSAAGPSEHTALLDRRDSEQQRLDANAKPTPTPLPWAQLGTVLVLRVSEPIAFTSIFPFVNRMIEDLHVTDDPASVGYYSGILESLFAVAQFLTVFHWGSLSDRIGRRPVILLGFTGVGVSVLLFGLSQAFWWACAARILAGALNGNAPVVRSMIGEMTDSTNSARAFSFFPLSWVVGSIIGPLLGGFLSRPAERYPSLFGSIALFKDFPYLLPCAVASAFTFTSVGVGYFYLKETLNKKRPEDIIVSSSQPLDVKPAAVSSADSISSASSARLSASDEPRSSTMLHGPQPLGILLRSKPLVAVLTSYFLATTVWIAFDVVLSLFAYTPVKRGGLSFSERSIGIALATAACFRIALQLLLFPPIQRRFGTLAIYQKALLLWFPVIAAFPVLSLIAQHGYDVETETYSPGSLAILWAALSLMLIIKCCIGLIFVCNMILVNAAAPSRSSLGRVNGLAGMVAAASHAVAPTMATTLFALSKNRGLLNGQLIWVVWAFLAFCTVLVNRRLKGL